MKLMGLFLSLIFCTTFNHAIANDKLTAVVTDVTHEYNDTEPPADSGETVKQLIVLGEKVWDFIIKNKPTAEYTIFKTSVVPDGVTDWQQLRWNMVNKPVSKVFRVTFKNVMGGSAGGFDYRITYFYGGTYKGKGKYLGQISVTPLNILLKTDRSLKFTAELAGVFNYGSEEDPIAAAQLIVSWSSPTTTRYQMSSAEFMLYGTGELQNMTNGN